jgi:hypothetical protein
MRSIQRGIAAAMVVCLLGSQVAQAGQATLIGTEQLAASLSSAPASTDHARLRAALARADLAAALQARGVSVDAVRARVDALTDAEAAELVAQIDRAPAGADVLGVLFSVFIILLVTDILGLTKVFPFTRPVR